MSYSNNDALPSPFLWGKIDAGPTHGLVRRPLFAERVLTADDTLQFCDFQLIVKPSPANDLILTLMSVRSWLNNPLGATPILVQDMMAVGTNSKTIFIIPNGSDKINGQSSWLVISDYASVVLRPLIDYTGWSAQ